MTEFARPSFSEWVLEFDRASGDHALLGPAPEFVFTTAATLVREALDLPQQWDYYEAVRAAALLETFDRSTLVTRFGLVAWAGWMTYPQRDALTSAMGAETCNGLLGAKFDDGFVIDRCYSYIRSLLGDRYEPESSSAYLFNEWVQSAGTQRPLKDWLAERYRD